MKKTASLLLALVVALQPALPAFAFTAGPSQNIPASGTLQGATSFSVSIKNVADDSAATQLNANSASSVVLTLPQYIEANFSDNSAGYQAIVTSTDNRNPSASPRFSPGLRLATGAGLVGTIEVAGDNDIDHGAVANDKVTASPLLWTVFDTAAEAKAFVFQGPDSGGILTGEAYVVDRQQSVASEMVPMPAPFIDTNVLGYASVVAGVSGLEGGLGSFPTAGRTTTDGQVFVRMAVNYKGQTAQPYATNTLTLELITF